MSDCKALVPVYVDTDTEHLGLPAGVSEDAANRMGLAIMNRLQAYGDEIMAQSAVSLDRWERDRLKTEAVGVWKAARLLGQEILAMTIDGQEAAALDAVRQDFAEKREALARIARHN